jgi:hypothetical protein
MTELLGFEILLEKKNKNRSLKLYAKVRKKQNN